MKKKLISIILTTAVVASMTACGTKQEVKEPVDKFSITAGETQVLENSGTVDSSGTVENSENITNNETNTIENPTEEVSEQDTNTDVPMDNQTDIEKPVIYLDGYTGEDVTIKLDFKGDLTMTYPEIGENNTWKVKALTDEKIIVDGETYRYLFWEGTQNTKWNFAKGSCVKGSETISFLKSQLAKFGLNELEIADFITYWGPRMINNNYNVISFQTSNYTDTAKLTVTPKPDKVLRVFMAWYASDDKVDIKPQEFKFPTRKGKVLIEWGGSEVDANSHTAITGKSVSTSSNSIDNSISEDSENQSEQQMQAQAQTQDQVQMPVQATVVTDPYAQYGAYAQCAKDWDATAAKRCGQTWAQLDAGTRGAAYNHWQEYKTRGW